MISVSDLELLGLSSASLSALVSRNLIKIEEGNVIILDNLLYDDILLLAVKDENIFRRIVEGIEDEKYYNYYNFLYAVFFLNKKEMVDSLIDVDYISFDLDVFLTILFEIPLKDSLSSKFSDVVSTYALLVDKYIGLHMNYLALNALENIIELDDSLWCRAIYSLIPKCEDKIKYVVDSNIYRADVILRNYRKYERELLFYLDINAFDKIEYFNDVLSDLYIDQNPLFFKLITLFLNRIKMFKLNRDFTPVNTQFGIMGDIDSVLISLLNDNDIYRVREIIDKKYDEDKYSIKMIMYKKLSDILLSIVRRNSRSLLRRLDLCAVDGNKLEDFFEICKLSSIPIDLVNVYEGQDEEVEEIDINYYHLYEECVAKRDFKNALVAIKKFQQVMKKMNITATFDYIEKDMEERMALISNKNNDVNGYYENYDRGLVYFKEYNFDKALELFLEALTCIEEVNTDLYSMIAICFFELDDIDNSLYYFKKLEGKYLYPKTILYYIDCLFISGNYRDILKWTDVYEKYYSLENARVHYISSIAAAELRDFDQATLELELTEMIMKDMYGTDMYFKYERDVLEKMQDDVNVECYSLDNYIDFELTSYEECLKEKIDEFSLIASDPIGSILASVNMDKEVFEERMEYLFSLLKILIMYNRSDEALKVYHFIESSLDEKSDDNEAKNYFTLILKNYRNL